MESRGPCGIDRAFLEAHRGFSVDRGIADPELNISFQRACDRLSIAGSAFDRNRALLNRRKRGAFSARTSRRTSFNDEDYRFASEIAIRIIERRDQLTLDDVLCHPNRAREFDSLASEIAPGHMPLQYRWAALSLRKARALQPELATRVIPPEDVQLIRLIDVQLESIPHQPGIYAFVDCATNATLYIGEASSLKSRLRKHLDHSDNKLLARHLWEQGTERILIEYYVLPVSTAKRELRAFELEQIQSRNPIFNIQGRDHRECGVTEDPR